MCLFIIPKRTCHWCPVWLQAGYSRMYKVSGYFPLIYTTETKESRDCYSTPPSIVHVSWSTRFSQTKILWLNPWSIFGLVWKEWGISSLEHDPLLNSLEPILSPEISHLAASGKLLHFQEAVSTYYSYLI